MEFIDCLTAAAHEYGLNLSEMQLTQFNSYFEVLIAWNQKINLTAITEPQEVAVKHMIDSLSCYQEAIFPVGCTIVDVGTGAGFPGIPLKIIRPDLKLTLLDSLNKRVLFLQEVVAKLKLENVQVLHSRAEDGGRNKELRERQHIAVSRAVARLNLLCEFCLPFVAVGGYFIALKGAQYQQELTEAHQAMRLLGGEIDKVESVILPGLDDVRAVIYIKKIRATPAFYPRRAGLAEKKPL
jgi:16S rRNA (guanine527-N7)-methyltransferase